MIFYQTLVALTTSLVELVVAAAAAAVVEETTKVDPVGVKIIIRKRVECRCPKNLHWATPP